MAEQLASEEVELLSGELEALANDEKLQQRLETIYQLLGLPLPNQASKNNIWREIITKSSEIIRPFLAKISIMTDAEFSQKLQIVINPVKQSWHPNFLKALTSRMNIEDLEQILLFITQGELKFKLDKSLVNLELDHLSINGDSPHPIDDLVNLIIEALQENNILCSHLILKKVLQKQLAINYYFSGDDYESTDKPTNLNKQFSWLALNLHTVEGSKKSGNFRSLKLALKQVFLFGRPILRQDSLDDKEHKPVTETDYEEIPGFLVLLPSITSRLNNILEIALKNNIDPFNARVFSAQCLSALAQLYPDISNQDALKSSQSDKRNEFINQGSIFLLTKLVSKIVNLPEFKTNRHLLENFLFKLNHLHLFKKKVFKNVFHSIRYFIKHNLRYFIKPEEKFHDLSEKIFKFEEMELLINHISLKEYLPLVDFEVVAHEESRDVRGASAVEDRMSPDLIDFLQKASNIQNSKFLQFLVEELPNLSNSELNKLPHMNQFMSKLERCIFKNQKEIASFPSQDLKKVLFYLLNESSLDVMVPFLIKNYPGWGYLDFITELLSLYSQEQRRALLQNLNNYLVKAKQEGREVGDDIKDAQIAIEVMLGDESFDFVKIHEIVTKAVFLFKDLFLIGRGNLFKDEFTQKEIALWIRKSILNSIPPHISDREASAYLIDVLDQYSKQDCLAFRELATDIKNKVFLTIAVSLTGGVQRFRWSIKDFHKFDSDLEKWTYLYLLVDGNAAGAKDHALSLLEALQLTRMWQQDNHGLPEHMTLDEQAFRWHNFVDHRITFNLKSGDQPIGSWPELIPQTDYVINGQAVAISSLTTREQLVKEGKVMGHCVGYPSYAQRCEKMETAILHIQGEKPSTVELTLGDSTSIAVIQHLGYRNSNPDSINRLALDRLIKDIRSGKIGYHYDYEDLRNMYEDRLRLNNEYLLRLMGHDLVKQSLLDSLGYYGVDLTVKTGQSGEITHLRSPLCFSRARRDKHSVEKMTYSLGEGHPLLTRTEAVSHLMSKLSRRIEKIVLVNKTNPLEFVKMVMTDGQLPMRQRLAYV